MCNLLLEYDANVEAKSQDGNLPLHYFARCNPSSTQKSDYIEVSDILFSSFLKIVKPSIPVIIKITPRRLCKYKK